MNAFREYLHFYRQFRERFETTGAIAPSSRFLAKALCSALKHERPVQVLEVGPGTGAVTTEIVRHLGTSDRLDLVEINEKFAELLRERFRSDGRFQSVADRARVHQCPLQEFRPETRFDVIISGLPFNNFSPQLVEELIDHCLELLAPGGQLAFFEYMFVRPVRQVISAKAVRDRLKAIEQVLQTRFADHRIRTDWVFFNVPPAWVQHLKKPDSGGSLAVPANAQFPLESVVGD